MYIIKRDGRKQEVHFDKITERIKNLINKEPILTIDPVIVAQKVVPGLYPGVTTTELDNLTAEVAVSMSTIHPDYESLASRLAISNLHKTTLSNYGDLADLLINYINEKTNHPSPLLSQECYEFIKFNLAAIQAALNYDNDYHYDYFGIKTLQQSYLIKMNGQVVERIQHLLMRVAIGIHQPNLPNVLKTYSMLSDKLVIMATPTLFNAGTNHPQLSSCFLLQIKEDSIEGIYDTLKQSAIISKWAGGIGISVHDVRAKNSYIKGTNGMSRGIVPMLQNFEKTACYVDQGGGKRKGSFAIYIEPHHADIEDFLEMKNQQKNEKMRCLDLFYGLWVSDLFMERVENNLDWSLFCPNEAPGLSLVYGKAFVELYEKYEKEGRARKVMKARDLWNHILVRQIETGTPYLMYKDIVNSHNNQSNLGTIKSSNLCVSGDTFILTDQGQLPIKSLVDKKVTIWNGEEWSQVTVKQTGVNQELVRVTLSNGVEIKCTPYHQFHLTNKIVDAQNLNMNDQLIDYHLPRTENIDCKPMRCDNKEFLLQIRLLFQTYGVDSKIVHNKLILSNDPIKVVSVEKLKEKEDTFCFTEPKRNLGMFNGVLIGNCSEIVEFTDKDTVAVCNLANVALPKCIVNNQFNFTHLYNITYHLIFDLNKVIDVNFYPVIEAKNSNLKHRPVGCGCIGLADTFLMLKLPFDSEEAKQLNKDIFETMYYAATRASCDLAKKEGPYESFQDSPASKGQLCPDLWGYCPSSRWDFDQLREDVKKYGLRNSLLISLQPTASTSNILGHNESIEPFTSNIYVRRILAGDYVMLNKFLIKDLINLNLWDEKMKNTIIAHNGSIQSIPSIPSFIKLLYRTVYEIKLKDLVDMNADRQRFVDQAISFNVFMDVPNIQKLTSYHFYAWKKGVKTSSYYLRTRPASSAVQVTVEKSIDDYPVSSAEKEVTCSMEEGCVMCGN